MKLIAIIKQEKNDYDPRFDVSELILESDM